MESEIFFLDAFDPLRKSDVEGALVIAGRENAPVHFVLADCLEEKEREEFTRLKVIKRMKQK